MKSEEVKVTFQPSGRTVYVLPGTVLLEAAGRAGIILQTPCGGRGTCGKCRVRIVAGSCAPAPGDLHQVLLVGAFGNFIRRNNARRIGLLPQIPCDHIRFIGNAASLGAKLALLSVHERQGARELQEKAEHVDLSLDAEFQTEFGTAIWCCAGIRCISSN